jgi:hypothetical protein
MRFEYEISADEYASCMAAYNALARGRKRIFYAVFWIALGLFFIAVARNEQAVSWAPILLTASGAYWVYCGLAGFFSEWYFRRFYPKSGMAGKKFQANIHSDGFDVKGESCTWQVPWSGVSLKAERERVFMLYVEGTIFMFGKKYLTDEQQNELRKLGSFAEKRDSSSR